MGNLKKARNYKSDVFESNLITGFDTVVEMWVIQIHRKEGIITLHFFEKYLYRETKKELINKLKFTENEK